MNNADLAEALATKHSISKTDARQIVDGLLAEIVSAAAKGEDGLAPEKWRVPLR
jgi:DNA-binding protein HU-beta